MSLLSWGERKEESGQEGGGGGGNEKETTFPSRKAFRQDVVTRHMVPEI
jgi:hypothetical protein